MGFDFVESGPAAATEAAMICDEIVVDGVFESMGQIRVPAVEAYRSKGWEN